MKIFINAATLKVGGGKSVLVNFLKSFDHLVDQQFTVVAVVPDVEDCRQLVLSNIRLQFVPSRLNSVFNRVALDKWMLRSVDETHPNVIFSMGNVALPIKGIPQLLLFHVPYPLYPESPVWKRMSIAEWMCVKSMGLLIHQRMKYATHVLVQTVSAQRRFEKIFGSVPTTIIPNGVSLANTSVEATNYQLGNEGPKLLCLARYYPHKNLEIFISLAEIIRDEKSSIKLFTTVSEKDGAGARKFLAAIRNGALDKVIYNIGPVPMTDVPGLYEQVDGMILPTFLESFSQTYIEAMFYRKPIFTSKFDFATDVCGDDAYYFDPANARDIFDVVTKAYADSVKLKSSVDKAFERVAAMPNWNHISATIFEKISSMCTGIVNDGTAITTLQTHGH